jgi:hypothetical protein
MNPGAAASISAIGVILPMVSELIRRQYLKVAARFMRKDIYAPHLRNLLGANAAIIIARLDPSLRHLIKAMNTLHIR